ncbi:hypothetical protein [Caloranaerobacter azorensis]|uniref:hypothetical protein n=1 Tax=Caloranaerobacter azorensis TaxID=116090 RepID=UPI00258D4C1A|nr:hypothetical protein [Caloranaerobacter azorensis]
MDLQKSKIAFQEAQKYIPGGVNSPVRAFKSVSINPPSIIFYFVFFPRLLMIIHIQVDLLSLQC